MLQVTFMHGLKLDFKRGTTSKIVHLKITNSKVNLKSPKTKQNKTGKNSKQNYFQDISHLDYTDIFT